MSAQNYLSLESMFLQGRAQEVKCANFTWNKTDNCHLDAGFHVWKEWTDTSEQKSMTLPELEAAAAWGIQLPRQAWMLCQSTQNQKILKHLKKSNKVHHQTKNNFFS